MRRAVWAAIIVAILGYAALIYSCAISVKRKDEFSMEIKDPRRASLTPTASAPTPTATATR